jgi:hypothetical protein
MRLAGERLLPHRRLGLGREDPLGVVGEACGDLRVERMPRAVPNEAHDPLLVSEQALEGGIDGEMDDPHRQRDLLTLRTPERSMAVPALDEVREQASHRPRKPQPVGQHRRHLAGGGEVRTRLPHHPRKPPRNLNRAHRPRALGVGKRADEPSQDFASRPVHDRVEIRRERIAVDLRSDVRVRGAARMGEQARVVGLPAGLAVDAEAVGEAHRDQRAVQAVLEREPHAEVRRQTQRRSKLRASDPLAALRRSG